MITAVLLNFEQIGQEEYKTIPYVKQFSTRDRIGDIEEWIKSIDSKKSIKDIYLK